MNNMVWIWLGAVALSALVESLTLSLVSVWFAVGALAATFAAYANAPLTVQLGLFVLVAIATWAVARPLAKRFVDPHIVPTNADRILGMEGKVTEQIDNEGAAGAVYVDGKIWTARSADGEIIPAGERVEIVRMEGVKLIVRVKAAIAVN